MRVDKLGCKGAAVVEFAVLFLLLLVLVVGIVEYGFLWMQSHYINTAAREGARAGARVATIDKNTGTVTNMGPVVRPAVEETVKDCLYDVYKDKTAELITGITVTAPGSEVVPALTVSVTVNTAAVWKPVLWSLLSLIPGCDTNKLGRESLTGSAIFAIEQR